MMGKFKVGDRVRRVTSSIRPESFGRIGQEYTVLSCECNGICVVEGKGSAEEENFELVAQAAAFKVGDRVNWTRVRGHFDGSTIVEIDAEDAFLGKVWPYKLRATDGDTTYATAEELEAAGVRVEAGKHYVTRHGERVGPMIKYDKDSWTGSPHGYLWNDGGQRYFKADRGAWDLVAEAPAPLQIEAGKFYRTRDGRKVGPARDHGFNIGKDDYGRVAAFFFRQLGDVDINGVWLSGDGNEDEDLVAEWIDEPVAASNDNEPAEPGRFKVGDRVVGTSCVGDPLDGVVIVADYDCPAHLPYLVQVADGERWCSEAKLSLAPNRVSRPAIVALIENGRPKPSTRPHVHASVTDAATEASRLANKHKGQVFGVYELVDQKQVAKPTYEYEWQRLAADGERTQAEAIIRRLTGITDWQARRIVSDWVRAA